MILQTFFKNPTDSFRDFPHTCKLKLVFLLAGRYFYAPSVSRCELPLGEAHGLHPGNGGSVHMRSVPPGGPTQPS